MLGIRAVNADRDGRGAPIDPRKVTMRMMGLALLLVLATSVFAADLEVGQPFPALSLPSLTDGSPTSVRDFRGQKLVLHVWASW